MGNGQYPDIHTHQKVKRGPSGSFAARPSTAYDPVCKLTLLTHAGMLVSLLNLGLP